ncbi:MAG: hypothetical protein AAF637_06000 [Pseudomonadota bacterium]
MELLLLDAHGGILERHDNHNQVVPFGRSLLLSALQGLTTTVSMMPYLGDQSANPASDEGLEGRGIFPLEKAEPIEPKQDGSRVILGFRTTAPEDIKVVGGGLGIIYRNKGSNKQFNGVYNFARTRSAVDVRAEMPLMLNFTLTVA